MPTVLITGAAGFLGSHLVDKFTQNGDTVIALTHSERSTQLLKKKHPSIKICIADLYLDSDKIIQLFMNNQVDYILHCAAMKHVNICEENATKCVETNVMGSKLLIDLCNRYHIKNLIAISTDKANSPSCVYGMTKHLMEKMVIEAGYSVYKGVNFFGSQGSVLDIWEQQRASKAPLVVNKQNCVRYFISVTEVVEKIYQSLDIKSQIITPDRCYQIKLHDLLDAYCDYHEYKDYVLRPFGNYEKLEEEISNSIVVEQSNKKTIKKLLKETKI